MPTSTDLVTDLPADFEVFGQAVDTRLKALQPGTTLGDLAYSSATANTNTRLPIGTNGQVLAVVAGVPAWQNGTTGDIEGVTAGTGISGGGTSGTVTITNSMATAIDAKGDLIAGTGADAFSRLAIGSNDQVLTADSAAATGMKWATPASGGMTVIATGTLSGATVTLSSIPGTYKDLQLVLEACLPAGTGEGPIIRFNGDTGTNYFRTTAVVVNLQTWNETQLRLGGVQDNGTSQSLAVCSILDYANTTTWKMARNMTIQNRNGTPTSFDINNTQALFWYASNGASAITSIELKTDTSAGFTSGTYILYGVK